MPGRRLAVEPDQSAPAPRHHVPRPRPGGPTTAQNPARLLSAPPGGNVTLSHRPRRARPHHVKEGTCHVSGLYLARVLLPPTPTRDLTT